MTEAPNEPARGVTPRAERIAACLIVQDEQERLPGALASVAFCDEVIVVDGGSRDQTVVLAAAAGAHVIESPWPGFAAQRNVALDAATSDWILEIDADERVSGRLRTSIEGFLGRSDPKPSIAVCPLRNRFLGGLLGPSAKYPAYRSRLFRRATYRHDESRSVHEGIEPHERPAVLEGDLEHELAATPREAVLDMWRYARLESSHIVPAPGVRAYLVGIAIRPIAKAAYRMIVDRGWHDGWRGWTKVLLDSLSDALVWLLVLKARIAGSQERGNEAASSEGHFGRRPNGPPKVVALAAGSESAARARHWLAALAASGADVALISDAKRPEGPIPSQPVRRLSPLATMRALDIEMQIRTVHAVVPFGLRAKLVHRMLPTDLRPQLAGLPGTEAD